MYISEIAVKAGPLPRDIVKQFVKVDHDKEDAEGKEACEEQSQVTYFSSSYTHTGRLGDHSLSEIHKAIKLNDKLMTRLPVIIVVSNPCSFQRRWQLASECIHRLENDFADEVDVYVVELIFPGQEHMVTQRRNPRHLQLSTDSSPLWHKENLINIGVKKLLPNDWKAFAWIDADIEFDSMHWASDALRILNGGKDIVQLFSQVVDMKANGDTIFMVHGFGSQYCLNKPFAIAGSQRWHPGYSWAITRKAYEMMGGLIERSIIGSADYQMACAVLQKDSFLKQKLECTDSYKQYIYAFNKSMACLRMGYVPGVIRHHYHGEKANRRYISRWEILVRHKYNPFLHVENDPVTGLLVPTKDCPPGMLSEIMQYFQDRNEDS